MQLREVEHELLERRTPHSEDVAIAPLCREAGPMLSEGLEQRLRRFTQDLAGGPDEGVRHVVRIALHRDERLGVDALVAIGGEDTLGVARRLHEEGVAVVGVPKTIDNDLSATDVTFGFDTAVQTATEAIDRLHTTAESHDRVMVVEVMGRNAGWIALQAGMAGGADVILMPEIPYDLEKVAAAIRKRESFGAKFSIVVVAEGAFPKGGQLALLERAHGGQVERLGGIGGQVCEALAGAPQIDTDRPLVRGGIVAGLNRARGGGVGKKPDVREFFQAVDAGGVIAVSSTPEAFRDELTESLAKWRGLMKELKLGE